MSLTIELPERLRVGLEAVAVSRGTDPELLAQTWLQEQVDAAQRESVCNMLRDWRENGDVEEQTETWEILRA